MSVTVTDPHANTQAAEIRRLLALGNPPHTVAAAVGCAIARVLAVRDQPADNQPPALPRPRPARPAARPEPKPAGPGPAELLAAAAGHDDPRITRLAEHITADLATLRALLRIADDREQHARALIAADRRAAAAVAAYDNRHPGRRNTDRQAAAPTDDRETP